jgi:acetylornithine deacetylase/succinyl-diaminopimelate desuccinylase-like protein
LTFAPALGQDRLMKIEKASLFAHARSRRAEYEALLAEFVEVPSVSADPAHKVDIERAAELAAATLRRFGGEVQTFRVPGGNPVIHAVFGRDPSWPAVTVYNHMDVQPASKETEPWATEPFVFTKKGDTYFGRGTTDDKGPALAALYGARAALDAGVRVNIRFLWELEEEIGSPHFAATLKTMKDVARTDSVVVSDTVWVSRGRPSISSGLRGLQRFIFTLETAATDQHSGTTGGAARNPVAELAQLAGELLDARTGRVKVPGFYDDVVPLTKKQLEDFRQSGFSVARFMKDHGFKSIRTKDPLEVMKRIWALPTLEVHGLVGGYTGPGVKTVVPPRAELKVSCRLVPDMRPARIARAVKAFVKKRYPDVTIDADEAALPFKGHTSGPYVEAVKNAIRFTWGKEAVLTREGGTIGAVLSMEQILKAPVLFLGLSLPDHGYHAPNENFDWGQAEGGIVAFAKYFEEVSRLQRR